MKTITSQAIRRIEMQGFTGCDIRALGAIRPWMRVAPGICGLWMAVGLIEESPPALWALAVFAALGVVLRVHPVDVPYNFFVRRWTRTGPIPSYGRPRRFACAMAALWASATAWALASEATVAALVLGSIFMASAFVTVTTDFCLGSWIYRQASAGGWRLPARRAEGR
jgi:hypothetical protein